MSEIQADDIQCGDYAITGTLYDFEGWPSGPLAGAGHFIALKFSDIDVAAAKVEVGLVPSEGTGLVELDDDKDAVLKITDKVRQTLYVRLTDAQGAATDYQYDLSGLTYEAPGA